MSIELLIFMSFEFLVVTSHIRSLGIGVIYTVESLHLFKDGPWGAHEFDVSLKSLISPYVIRSAKLEN